MGGPGYILSYDIVQQMDIKIKGLSYEILEKDYRLQKVFE